MVRGAQDVRLGVEHGDEVLFVPDVVAVGQNVYSGGEQLAHHLVGKAEARGAVFPVRYDEVEAAELGAQPRNHPRSRLPSRTAHNVSDKKHAHGGAYFAYSTARVSRISVTFICPG